MRAKKSILIDTDKNVYMPTWQWKDDVKYQHFAISMKRLSGGCQNGVDVLSVKHPGIEFDILPTRGMGIWKGAVKNPYNLRKCVNLGWESPHSVPVHPNFVPLYDPSGLGWLDGFNEWLVRCGLESNGSPEFLPNGSLKHSLHGKIANIPAKYVDVTVDYDTKKITVTGIVEESRALVRRLQLRTEISTFVGKRIVTVKDTITNLSAEPSDFQLLYHVNNGTPFVQSGARFVVPFEKMAPRTAEAAENLSEWHLCGPETPSLNEVVFFFDPAADANGVVKTLLINDKGNRGILQSFKKEQMPYFSLWKSRRDRKDGYVTGMEPSVNFPNTKSYEKRHGRVVPLAAGESYTLEQSIEILVCKRAIEAAEKEIRETHSRAGGVISQTVLPNWSE